MRKEDVVDRVTCSYQDRVLIERDCLKLAPKLIEIRGPQFRQKAVTSFTTTRHGR
jgi:hypothetical protein